MTTNTMVRSEIGVVLREFRKVHDMSQGDLAKACGISHAMISILENKPDKIITPAIHTAILTVGIDLKKEIHDLIVEKRRGKDRVFHENLSVPIKRLDPIKVLNDAVEKFKLASDIIRSKNDKSDAEVAQHKKEIDALEAAKKSLLEQKAVIMDQIISMA
jgi:transcriptional regulator with XRE-family HTH domain